MIIYKVTNKLNSKVYIGQTSKSLNERKRAHYKQSRLRSKTNFHRALAKYSILDFTWEEIKVANSRENLNDLEKHFIEKYDSFKSGYNMTLGGDGGDTISMKLDTSNQGAKKGNIPWNKGKSMRELGHNFYDTKKSRSKFTEQQKEEHSKLIKESKNFREGIKKRTPAKQVIIEDDLGNVWNRQKDFITYLNVSHHRVRSGLKDGVWEYEGRTYKVKSRKL
jgi:group I intron endonuclease